MNDPYDLVVEALKVGTLATVLRGDNGTELPTPYMCPGELPTDWERLIFDGLYRAFREHPEIAAIRETFERALAEMTVDPAGTYAAVNAFWNQVMNEDIGTAPFCIDRGPIIAAIQRALVVHEQALRLDRRWLGWNEPDGLWGEIMRAAALMKQGGVELVPAGWLRPKLR